MQEEQLEQILRRIDLTSCRPVIDGYIYYKSLLVKSRFYRGDGTYGYSTDENEFLIIASGSVKQGIIMRCGTFDLHWLVLKPWRNKSVLSNALRTGVVHHVWPENQTITCRYSWRDKMVDRPSKYNKTKHLAEIAGLKLIQSEE